MGVVDNVMGNIYAGDGTIHPSTHLLYIIELCALFKLAGVPKDVIMRKLFSLSLKDKACEWYRLLDDSHLLDWKELVSLFYAKFYPLHEIHQDRNYIYNFWPHDGESFAQDCGRLKALMLKCPNHGFPNEIIITNFYVRLSRQDKDMLDASSMGSFTNEKVDAKWELIERIQSSTKDWEIDKGKELGITYEYDCIKSFTETHSFNKLRKFGFDSHIGVNLCKLLASHINVHKEN
jgi:hypothetical protein